MPESEIEYSPQSVNSLTDLSLSLSPADLASIQNSLSSECLSRVDERPLQTNTMPAMSSKDKLSLSLAIPCYNICASDEGSLPLLL